MSNGFFFAGGELDRAARQRRDPAWVAARLADSSARIVPVWRNRSLIAFDPQDNAPQAAVFWPRARLDGIEATAVFLGLGHEGPMFAADVSALPNLSTESERFVDLRDTGFLLPAAEAAVLAYGRGLLFWHRQARFCGACGAPTSPHEGGHMRRCTQTECAKEHFPRTDPAAIMLVTAMVEGEEKCLLARQPGWPPGMYSTLAGFVEPGESLEETVVREVAEETGVTVPVGNVTYLGSQPWPFPASLMLGFAARATSTALDFDSAELEDARWFSRNDLAGFREAGRRLPRRHTVARHLIERWRNPG